MPATQQIYTERISVTLSQKELRILDEFAKTMELNRSAALRMLISAFAKKALKAIEEKDAV